LEPLDRDRFRQWLQEHGRYLQESSE
jgi:hypothetical protein